MKLRRCSGNNSWKIYPVRGEYCEVRGPRASLINTLVYPLPHHDGLSLGVHFTRTLWDTFLLGPTATYVEGKDNYERGRLAIRDFAESAKTLLPEIRGRRFAAWVFGIAAEARAADGAWHCGFCDYARSEGAAGDSPCWDGVAGADGGVGGCGVCFADGGGDCLKKLTVDS